MTTIAIINRSTVMTDAEVKAITAALKIQVKRHFAPIWGVDASLVFVGKHQKPARNAWWLLVLDNTDQADLLGYHDLTPKARPLGKVFAKTDQESDLIPSVTISHELLEMLVDPEINLGAQVNRQIYAYEVCDPCGDDEFAYKVRDVWVSDFVTPDWFRPTTGLAGPFDYRRHITRPLTLLKGGYYQHIALASGARWQEKNAHRAGARQHLRSVGRRERRRRARKDWRLSVPGDDTRRRSAGRHGAHQDFSQE
jgi:hypothetical protein